MPDWSWLQPSSGAQLWIAGALGFGAGVGVTVTLFFVWCAVLSRKVEVLERIGERRGIER